MLVALNFYRGGGEGGQHQYHRQPRKFQGGFKAEFVIFFISFPTIFITKNPIDIEKLNKGSKTHSFYIFR